MGDRTKRIYSVSSDSDDDSTFIKSKKELVDNDLYKWNIERCDFCDAVFCNKYSIMTHNASHIIIPLIKQNIHKCPICYYHYTSKTSLQEHMVLKHLTITNKKEFMDDLFNKIVSNETCTVITNFVDNEDTNAEGANQNDILKSLVLKQPYDLETDENFVLRYDDEEETVINNEDSDTFVKDEATSSLYPLEQEIINISDSESSTNDNSVEKSSRKVRNSVENTNNIEDLNSVDSCTHINTIKDRILFEDDEDDIFLLPNYLNDGDNRDDSVSNLNKNTIILGKYPPREGKSVHYEDLNRPGLFLCKICKGFFPNRYSLIVHETKHISINNALPSLCQVCDWYIPEDRYKAHLMEKHFNKTATPAREARCRRCNLVYKSFYKHIRNYHSTFVCKMSGCLQTFKNLLDYRTHKCCDHSNMWKTDQAGTQWHLKSMKICDICLLFIKDTGNKQYQCRGTVSDARVRMKCGMCSKDYIQLNVVNSQVKVSGRAKERNKITNVERLKNIQQRLKKLKMLNKF